MRLDRLNAKAAANGSVSTARKMPAMISGFIEHPCTEANHRDEFSINDPSWEK